MPATCEIEILDGAMAEAVAPLTFPAYRHLLSLDTAPRHPRLGDCREVRPFGAIARVGGAPAALVLVEQPLDKPSDAEILSVCVRDEYQGRGIATRLVEEAERLARRAGVERLHAQYVSGRPWSAAIERVLDRRGWDEPVTSSLIVHFTPDGATAAPWFSRVDPPETFEVFTWKDLDADEHQALRRSDGEQPWITPGLQFWHFEPLPIDPVSSVGARYRGRVVGWLITHRMSEASVRFTCAFMRPDLARRALLVPLVRESVSRLRAEGRTRTCTFATRVRHETMVAFIRKRCAPWASFVGETRESVKRLVQAS